MPDLTPGVASALSPLVRRIVAPNPGPFTGRGTNTYLVGIDEVAVIDPGPDDKRHIDAIRAAWRQPSPLDEQYPGRGWVLRVDADAGPRRDRSSERRKTPA